VDAETGEICDAGIWRQEAGRTFVSIPMDPAGSVFVVFRREAGQIDPVAGISPLKKYTSPLAFGCTTRKATTLVESHTYSPLTERV